MSTVEGVGHQPRASLAAAQVSDASWKWSDLYDLYAHVLYCENDQNAHGHQPPPAPTLRRSFYQPGTWGPLPGGLMKDRRERNGKPPTEL